MAQSLPALFQIPHYRNRQPQKRRHRYRRQVALWKSGLLKPAEKSVNRILQALYKS